MDNQNSLEYQLAPFFELNGVITSDQASMLIDDANERGWEEGRVVLTGDVAGDDFRSTLSVVEPDEIRKTTRSVKTSLIEPTPENVWLYDIIYNAGMFVNTTTYRFGIFELECIQLLKYNEVTNDHYTWHSDECICSSDMLKQRKLSCSIALNDATNYEGGVLQISNQQSDEIANSKHHLGKVGNATFFPSFMRHRVTPVTKGTRYSIVTWFIGPRWI